MKQVWVALMIVGSALSVSAGEIKAIVGDVPISGYDTTERVRLMRLQQPTLIQGIEEDELNKKALDILVNEQIKRQEAQKQGFSVSDSEVKDAVRRLEEQNNMASGYMLEMLKQSNIRSEALYNQIEADLLWMQVLSKNKALLKSITNKDIDSKKQTLKKELSAPSYLLAEIIVPTEKEANDIIVEIQRGKSFSEMASQKSKALSASTNGLLGWVKPDIYSPEVMDIISEMMPNEMTRPLSIPDGWLIVLLLDKRLGAEDGKIKIWDLAQLAISKNKTVKNIPILFKMTTCDDFMKFAEINAIKGSSRRGMTDPDQMPPQLKQALSTQKIGTPVGPIQTEDGDLFFMKCGERLQSILPSDEAIKSALEMEQMESLSEKLLRQIKRYIVVEYK
ncbi:MAG: peptidylprolyl isomerase [Alphaproteobacteria bacterium]|nr:peptidylprolyl isomerase [Alphaproteobacteria bacterium]